MTGLVVGFLFSSMNMVHYQPFGTNVSVENMNIKARVVATIFTVAVAVLLARQSSAMDYGGIGVRPANPDPAVPNSTSWFLYSLKPGEAKNDAVEVENNSAAAEDLVVYAADSTPSSDGGFALKQQSEQMVGVGSWVRFYPDAPPAPSTIGADGITVLCGIAPASADVPKSAALTKAQSDALATWCQGKTLVELSLKSMDSKNVPIVVSIPATADVGEHSGGIVIQKKAVQDQTQQGSAVILTTRVGARIYETVPGTILRSLQLEQFTIARNQKLPELTITVGIRNGGNVSVDHTTTVEVTDTLLHRHDKKFVRDIQALPGQELVTNFATPLPKFGRYTYHAVVTYNDGDLVKTLSSAVITKWFIPWVEVGTGGGILVILIAGLIVLVRMRRKKYSGNGWVPYVLDADTSIMVLAERSGVEWNTLARVNKLKAPYAVTKGQTVMVPPGSSLLQKKTVVVKKKTPIAKPKKRTPAVTKKTS